MTPEEPSPEAPYGWTLDEKTGQLRPKRRAGRPRIEVVADETDPEAHKSALRARQRQQQADFYERHPGYKSAYDTAWHQANPDKQARYMKKYNLKLKRQVMDAYGGKCACCDESELVFLTIDHIDGNGAEHRREMGAKRAGEGRWGQAGAPTYRWLRDNNFPSGFQVLCANCNCGKQWNGGICPHQVTTETPSSSQVRGPLITES